MTEAEAKKKICCGPLHTAGDREWVLCKASECMAWRWHTDGLALAFDGTEPIFRRPTSDPIHGYCGLAGKP